VKQTGQNVKDLPVYVIASAPMLYICAMLFITCSNCAPKVFELKRKSLCHLSLTSIPFYVNMHSERWWGETETRRQHNRREACAKNARRKAELNKTGGVAFDGAAAVERLRAMFGDDEESE
jgi:hypothetical protein